MGLEIVAGHRLPGSRYQQPLRRRGRQGATLVDHLVERFGARDQYVAIADHRWQQRQIEQIGLRNGEDGAGAGPGDQVGQPIGRRT